MSSDIRSFVIWILKFEIGCFVETTRRKGTQMPGFGDLGKILIIFGVVIVGIGVLLLIGDKIPWIGRLPGDIFIKKERFTFYFPIVTCIIISIILTILFSLFRK